MGNKYGGGHIAIHDKPHDEINAATDKYNLLLVEQGIRPAYLWYPNKKNNRITPPHSDVLEMIHIQYPKILEEKINKYYFIKKDNQAIKDKIMSLGKKKDSIVEGHILGYIYPKNLPSGDYCIIKFYCNPKTIPLWKEFAGVDCDLNKFGNRLQEIKTIIPSAFLDINYKKIEFGNPY
jgi:hypothetical protein